MAVIIDFSQTLHATIHTLDKLNYPITEENLRKILFDHIRKIRTKFKNKGEVIIALDSKSWRSYYFKYYKYKRKESRKDSDIDYDNVFKCFDVVINDLRDYFPFKVVQTHGAEGDDVVAVLAKELKEDTVIVARDKDFFQLHGFTWIKQYDPINNAYIEIDRNKISRTLFEHICKGDSTDGIPNILSPDDHFICGTTRQKSISTKMLNSWYELSEESFAETIGEESYKRFKQNRNLIDLSKIPEKVHSAIIQEYHKPQEKKGTVHSFLVKKQMIELLECASDFF